MAAARHVIVAGAGVAGLTAALTMARVSADIRRLAPEVGKRHQPTFVTLLTRWSLPLETLMVTLSPAAKLLTLTPRSSL